MEYILAMVIALLISMITMPFLMKLANKFGFTDKPSKRKQHKAPTPLCGGIALYIGFFSSYFLFLKDFIKDDGIMQPVIIFIAATMILIIGLIDDYYKTKGKEFPIFPRLVIQLLSAILVFKAGIVFRGFANPFTGNFILLSTTIQFLLTITWIFGVTTVINWSDGMDGLAGGVSLISTITFFVVAIILNQYPSALISIILAGTILGFLYYNRYPAKVFMGDSGANFLGFILSIIAIDGAFKQATILSLFIPILALAVPIFDNLFVIFKRFSEGKPVYQADRSQIHFRLEAQGFTPKQVVNYIMLVSLTFSLISIILLLIKR